eukprot:m.138493 g.138493  ORF g.138493 m.138493 type:complete len:110 (-) comp15916_c0_seq1:1974-2303(-)
MPTCHFPPPFSFWGRHRLVGEFFFPLSTLHAILKRVEGRFQFLSFNTFAAAIFGKQHKQTNMSILNRMNEALLACLLHLQLCLCPKHCSFWLVLVANNKSSARNGHVCV